MNNKNKTQPSKKVFYYENHNRDWLTGRIMKRDYSTYEAIECSLCHNPIGKPTNGNPSFSKPGKPNLVKMMGAGFKAPHVVCMDLGNVDYCEKCHIKMHSSFISMQNRFKFKK